MIARPQLDVLPGLEAWLAKASPVMLDNFLLGAESDAANARRRAQDALQDWLEQIAFLLLAQSFAARRAAEKGKGDSNVLASAENEKEAR